MTKGLFETLGEITKPDNIIIPDEKKEYQLIASFIKGKYFISTVYRRASTLHEFWYFETIIWEWDFSTKERGKMLAMENSGNEEKEALRNHFLMINRLA